MIKLFTLFNLAGLLLFNIIFAGDVSIQQDLPARMEPGTEVKVTVTVNKAQISGFAKLQIDLPAGLTANAIETRGASFTFADGKAKFIWMALPAQPSFKVSYSLKADAFANGSLPVTARLSYIDNNERMTVDAAPATIAISNTAVAAKPATEPAVITEQPKAEPVPQAPAASLEDVANATESSPIPDAAVTDTPGLPTLVGPGDVGAIRTVNVTGPTEATVEVTINKGLLRGFGKLQENLPAGFSAVAMEKDDAIFSSSGRVAKFVWLNLPSKNTLKVTYRLIAPAGAQGSFTLNGEFGYLLNDLTQRALVGSSTFTMAADAVVAQVPANKPAVQEKQPEPTEQPTTASGSNAQAIAKEQPAVTAQAKTPAATSTPAPETGILYKVQITAAHREVGKSYFMERHNYNGDFSIEHHEGWIKYVTGRFERYAAARDQRQAYVDAQYKFPGPFVTAYNHGERITVQEALMISKQQWVQ
ncbi:MAG: hypothetical protein M9900_04270 [Flavobacteriales bacterium]|nr:hypothetical protein [Flavobacteriales bacterium]